MAGISLNGTAFTPSDVPYEIRKIGKTLEMASGKRRFVQRTSSVSPIYKRKWEIPWNDIPEATRAAIETVAKLTTTFTYVDQHGNSFTVQTEGDPYKDNVSTISGDGTLYYNVTLTIYEA